MTIKNNFNTNGNDKKLLSNGIIIIKKIIKKR